MNVHRIQGMIFDNVAIDFNTGGNWSPKGIVYVTMSRFKSYSDLWVRGLSLAHIHVTKRARCLMEDIVQLDNHLPSRIVSRSVIQQYV